METQTKLALRPQPTITTDQLFRRGQLEKALTAMTIASGLGEDQITTALDVWEGNTTVEIRDSLPEGLSPDTINLITRLLDECVSLRWQNAVFFLAGIGQHIEDSEESPVEIARQLHQETLVDL